MDVAVRLNFCSLLFWLEVLHRRTVFMGVRGACGSTLLCFDQKSVKMDLNCSSENSPGRKEPDQYASKKANSKQLA